MRKAIKKPLTTKGLELMLNKLNKLTQVELEQITILNNSIMNNWQGIFPLKDEDKQQLKQDIEYKEIDTENLTQEEYIKIIKGEKHV